MNTHGIPYILLAALLATTMTAAQPIPDSGEPVCVNDTCLDVSDPTAPTLEPSPDSSKPSDEPEEEPGSPPDHEAPVSDQDPLVQESTLAPAPPSADGATPWTTHAYEVVGPYVEFILGGLLAGLVALQAFLAPGQTLALRILRRTAWLTMLPVIFLFSRIRTNKVLDQPVRAHLMQVIEACPGIDVDGLRRSADVAWSTARHHLRHLENHDMVRSARSGGHRIYFAASSAQAQSRRGPTALTGRSRRRVAQAIVDSPGITNAQIAQTLGLGRPSVTHHVSGLVKMGLVRAEQNGRQRLLQPEPLLEELILERASFQPGRPLVQATTA